MVRQALEKWLFLFAIAISFLNIVISFSARRYADYVGTMDESLKAIHTEILDIDARIALFRSTVFLSEKSKKMFKKTPEKVIYIRPLKDETSFYSYKQ